MRSKAFLPMSGSFYFVDYANDAFKKLAKEDVSEDEIKELEEQTQKLTDKYIKEVDQMVDVKSKEIMTV